MTVLTAGELVVSALQAESVDTVFGLIGSHTYGVYDALRRQNMVRHVSVCHESNATLAADAWAKVTNRTSVCLLTAGPGALNSISGLAQSYFSATPMVHITGSPPNGAMRESLHGLNKESCSAEAFSAVSKRSWRPQNLGALRDSLALAFKTARSGRHGPVHIEIPIDLMEAPAEDVDAYAVLPNAPAPCPASVAQPLAVALIAANRPLFCFDKGVLRSGMSERLVKLAERLNAGLVVSRDAIGAIPDTHPLYVGVAHDFNFGTAAFKAVAEADLVVCFGFSRHTENLHFVRQYASSELFLFAFEDQQGAFEGGYCADLDQVTEALEQAIKPLARGSAALSRTGDRYTDQREQIASLLECHRNDAPVHFGWALTQLRPYVDSDCTVVLDAGTHEVWGRTILPVHGPGSQIGSANWATMGYTLPGMIGARLAAPERRIIGITGDGCLLMALSDLTTWLQAGGPSVLVVLNDGEYGMIAHTQIQRFGGAHATDLRPVNFAELIETMGGIGLRINEPALMLPALETAFAAHQPVLLDIVCSKRMGLPSW